MRIALINENSQAAKNEMVYNTLKKVAESKGHTVDNYGIDRKSTRLNSSHSRKSRMPSSA